MKTENVFHIQKINFKSQTWASISWSVSAGSLSNSGCISASSAWSFFKVLTATSSRLILSVRTARHISGHFSCSAQANSFWRNKRSLSSSSISVSALVIKILKTRTQDSTFKASSSIKSTSSTESQSKHNTHGGHKCSASAGSETIIYHGHTQSRSHIQDAVTSNYYHSQLRQVNK